MKKLILNPSSFNQGEVLTRAQLKKVMGGLGSESGTPGSCTVTFVCGTSGTISCTSANGICKREPATKTENAYVQCDDDPKTYC
ncbi:hypothetical protein EZ456_07525 [Pedobacter psychrodurus]|uniref:Natural product n=1 Tax=Pedobacter psychrodurus TaxID=2530456 RepID=A0A4V2MR40_9SPHI|nr:hypothetical protein [Pedobacter psychrodurus]TCD27789.1 hypothetical protein EZ456_07525 [Pedobacter psychrodurus]